jgi:transcriptional regulator with XRE-family HTH domain
MYFFMKKLSWEKFLTGETKAKLLAFGELLENARKLRGMSIKELSERIGTDRRTLSKLEKGNPTVSLGVFFQVLSALNLLWGIEEIVRPENDIESIAASIRRIRSKKRSKKTIGDNEVDF